MPFSTGPLQPPPVSDGPSTDTPLSTYDPSSYPFTGLELTVSGLDRSGPRSAHEHLKIILAQLENDGHLLPKLHITPGASRTSNETSDYVTVSLTDPYRSTPRPDILEFVRKTLDDVPGITALWRILNGPDKSRQLSFFARNKEEAPKVKEKLERFFKQEHYHVQSSWIWQGTPRLTFNFVSRKAVENLLAKSPVLEARTFVPIAPTYVQPVYGLEVGVSNVGAFPQAQLILDSYVKSRYGVDAWRSSRLELNGTIYCVVLRDPEVTTQFLTDPFEAFPEGSVFKPNKPDYLYKLNSAGIPNAFRRPYQAQAHDSLDARQQMDKLMLQLLAANQRFVERVMDDQRQFMESLINAQDRFTTTFLNALTIQAAQSQLVLAQSDLNNIRASMSTAQLLLLLEKSPENQSNIRMLINSLQGRTLESQDIVNTLWDDINRLQSTLMPVTPIPPSFPSRPTGATSAPAFPPD
ncbi:hypothetical protein D9615_008977 [Tricholomella constricta]|uniref:Uncharacterized protein n=1 Tax=Tricholomella constricta TaxID=117010 RepID=A0A8H5H0T1_9AGAR|nr:hypothetical protein D9615_008977 [Tricholomella constricta]